LGQNHERKNTDQCFENENAFYAVGFRRTFQRHPGQGNKVLRIPQKHEAKWHEQNIKPDDFRPSFLPGAKFGIKNINPDMPSGQQGRSRTQQDDTDMKIGGALVKFCPGLAKNRQGNNAKGGADHQGHQQPFHSFTDGDIDVINQCAYLVLKVARKLCFRREQA